jgi:predicted phosphoribosyltransferase
MFEDRQDAGRRLAKALRRYRNSDVVVLGLPRGGVPIALEIARMLKAPMSVILVRKIGLPQAPEVAMGAVVDGPHPYVFKNSDMICRASISDETFQSAMRRELDEIARRKLAFRNVLPDVDIAGKTVVLVDDGIATGSTMKAAALAIQQCGVDRIVVAVPVAPASVIADIESEAEEVVCLEAATSLLPVDEFYRRFPQLSDDDVIGYLRAQVLAQD